MIAVVCLVLRDAQSHLLATQRGPGKRLAGCWEFPGGKVEPEEAPEAALRREIREELHLELGELTPLAEVVHAYDFGTIRLLPFLSTCSERPTPHLTEHTAVAWVSRDQWRALDWAPADVPILERWAEGEMGK